MDYQGMPCKRCKKIITVYSASGYCRHCWHEKRGGKTYPGSSQKLSEEAKRNRIAEKIKQGREDLTHYHYLQVDGVRIAEHQYIWLSHNNWDWDLLRGKVIHHINGLKGDNRYENLIALTRCAHVNSRSK